MRARMKMVPWFWALLVFLCPTHYSFADAFQDRLNAVLNESFAGIEPAPFLKEIQDQLIYTEGDSQLRMAEAILLFRSGEFLQAEASLSKLNQHSRRSMEMMAECLRRRDKPFEASQWYLKLAEADDNTIELRIGYLAKYLQMRPNDKKAQLRLARLYEESGQESAAADFYVGHLEHVKKDTADARRVAHLLVKTKRCKPAEILLEHLMVTTPRAEDAILLAECREKLQDWVGALSAWHSAYSLAPTNRDVQNHLLSLLTARGEHKQLEAFLNSLLPLRPNDLEPALALAKLQLRNGSWRDAYRSLEGFAAKEGINPTFAATFARTLRDDSLALRHFPILKLAASREDSELSLKLALADAYSLRGEKREAVGLWLEAYAKAPDSLSGLRGPILDMHGQQLDSAGRKIELSLARKWLKANPKDAEMARLIVEVLSEIQAPLNEQIAAMERHFALTPKDKSWHLRYAKLQLESGDSAKALNHALAFNSAHPDSASGRELALSLLAGNTQLKLQADLLDELLALSTRHSEKSLEYSSRRALIAVDDGDGKRAWELLHPLKSKLSGSSDYWVAMGRAQQLQKDTLGAKTSFRKALDLKTDNLNAIRYLLPLLESVREMHPLEASLAALFKQDSTPEAGLGLARIHYGRKQYSEAARIIGSLLKKDSNHIDTPEDLQIGAHSLAEDDKGAQALILFSKLWPPQTGPVAKQDLGLLEQAYHLSRAAKNEKLLEHFARLWTKSAPTSSKAWETLAVLLQEKKRQDEAVEAWKGVLSTNATHQEALIVLAEWHWSRGEKNQALPYMEKIPAAARSLDTKKRLAEAYAETGQWAKAQRAIEAALEEQPDDPSLSFSLYHSLEAQGRKPQALKIISKASGSHPDDPRFARVMALNAYEQKNCTETVRLLDRPFLKDTLNGNELHMLVDCHMQSGNHSGMEKSVETLRERFPQKAAGSSIVAKALLLVGQSDAASSLVMEMDPVGKDKELAFLLGKAEYEKGRYTEAQRHLELALGGHPEARKYFGLSLEGIKEYEKATTQLMQYFEETGEVGVLRKVLSLQREKLLGKDALKTLEILVQKEPKDASLRADLAEQFLLKGDSSSAVKHYEIVLALQPAHQKALLETGTHLASRSECSRALPRLESGISPHSENARAWWLLGKCREEKGEQEKAFQAYTRARSLGLASDGLNQAYLALARNLQRDSELLVIYQDRLAADSQDLEATAYLGDHHFSNGNYAKAIPFLEVSLMKEPDDKETWSKMGIALLETGKFDKAEEALQKAMDMGQNDGSTMLGLARSYRAKGWSDVAESILKTLVEENPKFHQAFYWQSQYLSEDGDYDKALRKMQQAIQLSPGNADYRRTLSQLEQMVQSSHH